MTTHTRMIGTVCIGAQPRVVGTTVTRAALAELASGERLPECDIVEIRLDLIAPQAGDAWWRDVDALQQRGTPVLATDRAAFEGGQAMGDTERRGVLERAQAHCACIDIESRSALCAELCDAAARQGKPIIVSYHDFEATPAADVLHRVIDGMCTFSSAIPKIATMIKTASDVAILEAVLARDIGRPRCLIGMGPLGTSTRTDLATQGSALAYGFLDASGAPGQIFCGDMLNIFAPLRKVAAGGGLAN